MHKYQQVFVDQLNRTRRRWEASGSGVAEYELYRYLHSVKGTAATIGLAAWTEQAALLLPGLQEEGERLWSLAEVDRLLAPLYALFESVEKTSVPLASETVGGLTSAESVSSSGMCVLLIDDDDALLQLIKEKLEEAGFLVFATPSPRYALTRLAELKPDCILMDVNMPGMSGHELLSHLREEPDGALVPIVLMSGEHDRESRIRAYASDADEFVAKPLDMEELIARLAQCIRRKRALEGRLSRPNATEASVNAPEPFDSRAWNIAIIDDDPIIRSMMKRRLELMSRPNLQLFVRAYEDGQSFFDEGWHRADGRFLVLLDRMMPRMNGMEVLARLRREYPAERFRVLMLTGVGEETDIAQALRLGADDYVTKPFRLPELEARLERLLQGRSG